MPPPPSKDEVLDAEQELTPEEQQAWEAGIERVAEEKRKALLAPGPTWRQWFFYDHAKWWVGLGFLIVDSWIVSAFVHNGSISRLGIVEDVGLLVVAGYLEILLYRYLWRRPAERHRGPFRPSLTSLTEVGRWTPEADEIRRGIRRPASGDGSPDPRDFL